MELLCTSRDKWGAVPVTAKLEDMELPIKHVFHMDITTLRCRDATSCEARLREIQKREMYRVGHRDLRYNFVVGGNGMVYEGRGWTKRAILPHRYFEKVKNSIVIGYIGRSGPAGTHIWMDEAASNLVKKGITLGYIEENYQSVDLCTKNDH